MACENRGLSGVRGPLSREIELLAQCSASRDRRAGSDGRRSGLACSSSWPPISRSESPGHRRSIHESAFGVIMSRRPPPYRRFGVAISLVPTPHPHVRDRGRRIPRSIRRSIALGGSSSSLFGDRCSGSSRLVGHGRVAGARGAVTHGIRSPRQRSDSGEPFDRSAVAFCLVPLSPLRAARRALR